MAPTAVATQTPATATASATAAAFTTVTVAAAGGLTAAVNPDNAPVAERFCIVDADRQCGPDLKDACPPSSRGGAQPPKSSPSLAPHPKGVCCDVRPFKAVL